MPRVIGSKVTARANGSNIDIIVSWSLVVDAVTRVVRTRGSRLHTYDIVIVDNVNPRDHRGTRKAETNEFAR